MGNINLSGFPPAFSSKQVQAAPAKDNRLPPAELSKPSSPTDCLAPADQTNLPDQTNLTKSMASGSSQTALSFLDNDLQAEDLPSDQEFTGLLKEISQANASAPQVLPSAGPLKRRYLDDNIISGKPLLEKIRQAADREPPSPEAQRMLWLLEEHNKITQGYRPAFREHLMAYADALQEYLPAAAPEPGKNQLSADESLKLREQIKEDYDVRTRDLIKP